MRYSYDSHFPYDLLKLDGATSSTVLSAYNTAPLHGGDSTIKFPSRDSSHSHQRHERIRDVTLCPLRRESSHIQWQRESISRGIRLVTLVVIHISEDLGTETSQISVGKRFCRQCLVERPKQHQRDGETILIH